MVEARESSWAGQRKCSTQNGYFFWFLLPLRGWERRCCQDGTCINVQSAEFLNKGTRIHTLLCAVRSCAPMQALQGVGNSRSLLPAYLCRAPMNVPGHLPTDTQCAAPCSDANLSRVCTPHVRDSQETGLSPLARTRSRKQTFL